MYEKFDKKWHEKSKLEIVKTRNKSEEQIVSKDLMKSIISFWSSMGYSNVLFSKLQWNLMVLNDWWQEKSKNCQQEQIAGNYKKSLTGFDFNRLKFSL